MVDTHCHILPIDDGARNIDESVAMARKSISEGITDIIATPHFDASKNMKISQFLDEREKYGEFLTLKLKEENISVRIHCAAEIMIHPNIIKLPLDKLSVGGRFILFELPHTGCPIWLKEILYEIGLRGYTPIMAHPERYDELMHNTAYLTELTDGGLLLQSCIRGADVESNQQKRSRALMYSGMISLIASDSHSASAQEPGMTKTLEKVAKLFGNQYVQVLKENSIKILNGIDPDNAVPSKLSLLTRIRMGGIK